MSERSRVIGISVLSVEAWYSREYEKTGMLYGTMFWAPYFNVFQSYLFRVDCVWNVMAHTQKLDFDFRRNGRVHLNRWGRQFIRLLAAEVCASAVVMLDKPCSEVVWRVLTTDSIHQYPLQFPSRASPCAITFQLHSTTITNWTITHATRHWKY